MHVLVYYNEDENLVSYWNWIAVVIDGKYCFKNDLTFSINKHIYVQCTHIITRLLLQHNLSYYHMSIDCTYAKKLHFWSPCVAFIHIENHIIMSLRHVRYL